MMAAATRLRLCAYSGFRFQKSANSSKTRPHPTPKANARTRSAAPPEGEERGEPRRADEHEAVVEVVHVHRVRVVARHEREELLLEVVLEDERDDEARHAQRRR